MALVTLSGTISAADLNTNFGDKTSSLQSTAQAGKVTWQYDLECLDLVTSTSVALRTLDFTAPDDLEFVVLCLNAWNSTAVTRIATGTLTAIDVNEQSASKYLLGQPISLSVTCTAASTEYNATRDDRTASTATKIWLAKGVTYRLQVSQDTATVLDRVVLSLVVASRRRRA